MHMAFLGPESQWSAEASECAAEQDAFWAYHDLLFERHGGENRGAFNKDNLKGFAAELGLDIEAFNTCLDSGKYASLVQTETASIQSLGVRGTPAFLINGQPLVGAQPFEAFQQVIEAELGAN
jgi:protein-disulfide isomerase